MTVEIPFPFEFNVQGTPVSLQAKRADARSQWKERVKSASREVLPDGFFSTAEPLSVTILYFPDAQMQGDIDNIVKPILDALCRHVYIDDHQVERIWVQKFEPGRVFAFDNPSPRLTQAIDGEKPVVFVRLDYDLDGSRIA